MSGISNAAITDRFPLLWSQPVMLNIGNLNFSNLTDLDFPDASGEQPAR